jgi:1,4-alpha-glucan branching enzyme
MTKYLFLLGLALVASISRLTAQVSCTPVFPSADDNITLTFDANEGAGGLANLADTVRIYGHFGAVIASPTSTAWTNVIGNWGTDDARTKMTNIGGGKYTISFNIRTFFNIAAGVPIYRIASVYRTVNGSKEGKGQGNSDIYYDIIQPGAALQTRIVTPSVGNCKLVQNGTSFTFKGAASANSILTLTDNGVQIASATNAKELSKDILATGTAGFRTVIFKAVNGTVIDSQRFQYFIPNPVVTAAVPSGMELGANFNTRGDSATFVFHAPRKDAVFVIGSFNNYDVRLDYQMNRADSATWWFKMGGLTPNQIYTYQYAANCAIRVADPLSTLVLDPTNDPRIPAVTYPNPVPYPTGRTTGYVSVIQPGKAAYNWRVPNFTRPLKTDLVIYELLPRDFVARHDFQTLIDTLNYLKKLNINAIELMPINEFQNNESWGYNPTFHNAIDKYYGTPDKFKEFVDICHQNGIAVICDIVFNQIDGGALGALYGSADNPWLNPKATHPFSVFTDMNHESRLTKAYVNRCLKYWLQEYRIDGYRFDLSKGFTQKESGDNVGLWGQYDQSRIDILKGYHQTVQQTSPGAYSIMEHFADNSEETVMANDGMMLWNNVVHRTNEATMGYSDNSFRGYSAKSRGWTTAANSDKLISYPESHDEERLMFKNLSFGKVDGNYSTRDIPTALRRMELATAFVYAIPGPRMLWQFGELGYDQSIDLNGRTGGKPILWNYFADANRKRLYNVTSNMIGLRTSQPLFRTTTYDDAELNAGYQRVFHLSSADLNVTIVGNFNTTGETFSPNFQKTGKWYDYLSGDSITVTTANATRTFLPGEYHVYTDKRIIPPAGFISTRVGTAEFAEEATDFQVYPTPSVSGRFFVGYTLKNGAEVRYDVINLQGQSVVNSAARRVSAGSHQEEITTSLVAGTYLVRLSVNGVTATHKLVIQ